MMLFKVCMLLRSLVMNLLRSKSLEKEWNRCARFKGVFVGPDQLRNLTREIRIW